LDPGLSTYWLRLDEIENTGWLELLLPFTAAKDSYMSEEIALVLVALELQRVNKKMIAEIVLGRFSTFGTWEGGRESISDPRWGLAPRPSLGFSHNGRVSCLVYHRLPLSFSNLSSVLTYGISSLFTVCVLCFSYDYHLALFD
jgi:hypothetical protein